jgi:hypothetical protein
VAVVAVTAVVRDAAAGSGAAPDGPSRTVVICTFITQPGCARYDIERKRDVACVPVCQAAAAAAFSSRCDPHPSARLRPILATREEVPARRPLL